MHGSRHHVDADALLAHGEFVRALARRLVFDDDRVDDVVQETWLAALEHAPERPRSLRAWLARVARNVALKAARTESRRRRRDEGAPGPRPPEPPPDAIERLARGRQVVDAVLALDEPYRTTVVLRFYEDLEPKEIARRLGVNGATVRTRLKRGLDMLRARLDRDAGSRRAWCLALLPVLVPHGHHIPGGILLMGAKTKLPIAAVLVLAAMAGLLVTWGWRGSDRVAERAARAESPPPGARSEGVSGTIAEAERTPGSLRVVVRVENEAGVPLAGAMVEAHASYMPEIGVAYSSDDAFYAGAMPSRPVAAVATDARGIAVFRHDPGLAFVYRATKDGYAADSGGVMLRAGIDPDPVALRLGTAHRLSGFVLDDAGQPVAGAPVLAADPTWGPVPWDWRLPSRTVTGGDGAYRFDDLPARDVALWAALPGGVPLRVATLRFPHLGKFDIVIEPGGMLSGTVTDADTGEPIEGARVRAVAAHGDHRAEAYTDVHGCYEIRTLPAAYVSTVRFRKDGYCPVFDAGGNGEVGLRLGRGDTLRVDGRLRRAPTLRGTVSGPDGRLSGVPVQLQGREPRYGTIFMARTDEAGRYAVAAAPGRFIVTIGVRSLHIPGALGPSVHPDNATGEEANVVDMPERGEVVRDFLLAREANLILVHGRVVDRDGQPVARASVGPWGNLSSEDGSFETLAPRGRPVWAGKPGCGYGVSEPVREGVEALVVLVPQALLSGTLAARDGSRVEGAFVLLSSESGEESGAANEQRIPAPGGRYEIRNLFPGAYRVRAAAVRHALTETRRVVLDSAAEKVLDFVLEGGETIRGRAVESDTGASVRGAWIHVVPVGRRPDTTWQRELVVAVTDADGGFVIENLASGEYEVRAEAPGFLAGSARTTTNGAVVAVALEPTMEIGGIVTFTDGGPGAGLDVFAVREGASDRYGARGTSPQGRFVVKGLAPGTYRVTAGGRGARSSTSSPVEAGTQDVRLVVERAAPGETEDPAQVQEGDATLEGRVVDPSGAGLARVQVFAAPMTSKRLGRSTRSGADGRFVLRGLASAPHRVRARFDDGGLWQTREDVTPGRDVPVLVFASLQGTIAGESPAGRQIAARRRGDGDGGWNRSVVRGDGSFRIEGLPPGRYEMSFVNDRPHLLLEGGEDVEAGRDDLALRASRGASITGVVADESGGPLADAPVGAVARGFRDGPSTRSREDGRFELTGLRAGVEYFVVVSIEERVPAHTLVRAPVSDVRIVVEKGFEASGRVLEGDGKPVPAAQLRFIPQGHDAHERSATTDSQGRFTATGLREGEYRVELWPRVRPKTGDREWQPVGTIRARDRDVELRMK